MKPLVEECKDGPSRRKYKDVMVLPMEEMTLANQRKVACRALGLPEGRVCNEAELRKTRLGDPVVRCHAIDTLIWLCTNGTVMRNLEEERLRGDQLKLPGSRKLLPGPRKLCDKSGVAGMIWAGSGYYCYAFDIQHREERIDEELER